MLPTRDETYSYIHGSIIPCILFSSNDYVKIIFPSVLQPSNGIRKRVIGRSLKFHPLMGSPVKKTNIFLNKQHFKIPAVPPPILNRVYST